MTRASAPGREWTIVKLRPDGGEAARYRGVEIDAPAGWIAARAVWGYRRVDIGALAFEPGDRLDEYFALDQPYNAFAIFRADGAFAGWYANVTCPTMLADDEIRWRDLYVDVVVAPDGRVVVLDEDELADAGLAASDPQLHQRILAARDRLLEMVRERAYPFSQIPPRDG